VSCSDYNFDKALQSHSRFVGVRDKKEDFPHRESLPLSSRGEIPSAVSKIWYRDVPGHANHSVDIGRASKSALNYQRTNLWEPALT
jgi:hypothetical protein